MLDSCISTDIATVVYSHLFSSHKIFLGLVFQVISLKLATILLTRLKRISIILSYWRLYISSKVGQNIVALHVFVFLLTKFSCFLTVLRFPLISRCFQSLTCLRPILNLQRANLHRSFFPPLILLSCIAKYFSSLAFL